jgi:hypothetical protein
VILVSNQVKTIKRGETLFKEGDNLDSVFLIQKGQVEFNLNRNGKKIEIAQVRTGQIIGDESLIQNSKAFYTAEAVSQVSFLEVPYSVLKMQLDTVPGGIKMLVKSFTDELKQFRQKAKSSGLEQESTPCPDKLTPRLFCSISLIAQHLCKKNEEGNNMLDWPAMKLYGVRFFMETPKRMIEALKLLSKLNYVELKYEKNEDGVEEIDEIQFDKIEAIEMFAQYFQYHLYKGGRSESLIADRKAIHLVKSFISLSEDEETDFRGAVKVDFNSTVAHLKNEFQIDFNSTHIDILEKKGLFIKRLNEKEGVSLSFDKNEFLETLSNWEVLYEIKLWNEKGFVDIADDSLYRMETASEIACTDCGSPIDDGHKFCPECGFKLVA